MGIFSVMIHIVEAPPFPETKFSGLTVESFHLVVPLVNKAVVCCCFAFVDSTDTVSKDSKA